MITIMNCEDIIWHSQTTLHFSSFYFYTKLCGHQQPSINNLGISKMKSIWLGVVPDSFLLTYKNKRGCVKSSLATDTRLIKKMCAHTAIMF